jgi:uncharacterized protein
MTDIWAIAGDNLRSPIVLAFALGMVATLVRSDLKIPEAIYTGLSIYLLLAIGLKGGAALNQASGGEVALPLLLTLAVGILTPILVYNVLRRLGKFDRVNSAAMAAHYGSVSAVTFIACQSFLQAAQVPFEGYTPVLLAVLEVPGIVLALLIVKRRESPGTPLPEALRETIFGKSILLLLGGVAIGFVSGPSGLDRVAPVFVAPFQGALVLFLLDLGMVAAHRLADLRKSGAFLIVFALAMPVVLGAIGVYAGHLGGLSTGGMAILGTMAGSASYIAAPAAVRVALPEANPAYYLTTSLGVTFPFNLTLGIPLYTWMAQTLSKL